MAHTLIIEKGAEQVCRMPEVPAVDPLTSHADAPATLMTMNDTVIVPAPVITIGSAGPASASAARQFGSVTQFTTDSSINTSSGWAPFDPAEFGMSQQDFEFLSPDIQRMYRAGHNGLEYLRHLDAVRNSGDAEGMVREFNNRLQPPQLNDMLVVTLEDGTEILQGHARAMRELLGHEVSLKREAPVASEQKLAQEVASSPEVAESTERAVSYALEAPMWAKYQPLPKQAQIMEAYQDAMAPLHAQPWFLALDAQGQEKARAILINDVNFDSSFLGRMESVSGGGVRFQFMDRQLESIREREEMRRSAISPEEFVWRARLSEGMVNHFGIPAEDARVFVKENRDAIASLWSVWQELPTEVLDAHRGGFPEFVFRQQVEVRKRQAAMAEARDPRRIERAAEPRPFEVLDPARGRGVL